MKAPNRIKQKGVTIVELVITMVIISFALVTVVNAFYSTTARSSDPLWEYKTLKLAQLYFDEILTKRYDESTPVGGVPAPDFDDACPSLGPESESRDTFDDVDDYITAGPVQPDIISATGITLDSTYDDYRIEVDVVCDGDGLGLAGGNDGNAKLITLTIYPPSSVNRATTMKFSVYRGNF